MLPAELWKCLKAEKTFHFIGVLKANRLLIKVIFPGLVNKSEIYIFFYIA